MVTKKKRIIVISFILLASSLPYIGFVHAENEAFVLKWSHAINFSVGFGIGPLAADINNDGIMEIFILSANGSNREILCLTGSTGDLIWSITPGVYQVPHNPMELYDLNNNGDYELVVPSPGALSVYHAENGTLWWRNTSIKCSEAHQLVLDTDGTGFPYIYTVNANNTNGELARLRKINASTGKAIISVPYHYACHGGLTAGDVNSNGSYLLFGSDRNYNGGKGLRCYDADTLELKWYRSDVLCSSHLPVLYDVTGDGILEVIISYQRYESNAGMYVINALTGQNIPGMYQNSISGMAVHEQLAVHRFSNRDDVYVATGCYDYGDGILMFNLNNWSIDANLGYAGRPPYFANVMGDQELEIIVATEVNPIRIYNDQFQLIYTLPIPSEVSCYTSIVQDIDGDGLNELITISSDGLVRVYDTLADASSPLPRTQTNHYSEMNTRAAVYTPLPKGEIQNNAPNNTSPEISDIHFTTSNPVDIDVGFGWENISCVVSDNISINNVLLNITDPDGSTQSLIMNQLYCTNLYFFNTTLLNYGTFSYFIWANNTNNNQAISDTYVFSKPPNWDIDNNGICTILDLIFISNRYGESGSPGWIREDIDNNGQIQIYDFITASIDYSKTWNNQN